MESDQFNINEYCLKISIHLQDLSSDHRILLSAILNRSDINEKLNHFQVTWNSRLHGHVAGQVTWIQAT